MHCLFLLDEGGVAWLTLQPERDTGFPTIGGMWDSSFFQVSGGEDFVGNTYVLENGVGLSYGLYFEQYQLTTPSHQSAKDWARSKNMPSSSREDKKMSMLSGRGLYSLLLGYE